MQPKKQLTPQKEADLIRRIHAITDEIGLPYFELRLFQGYENLFTYVDKPDDCADKNNLYLYSCTKPLTVTCALQLWDQGLLSLDDALVKYLPAFEKAFTLDTNGNKQIVGPHITLRHLFTMTAGFDYNIATEPLKALFNTQKNPSTAAFVDTLAEHPLQFVPGTQFNYSLCLDVLARVVEVVSGQRFSAYMQEHILTPLQMSDCGFHDNDFDHMLPQYIVKDGKIVPYPLRNDLVPSTEFDSGGAGLIGTTADYTKFAVALANDGVADNGYRLLQPETIRLMSAPHTQSLRLENQFTCVQGDDYSYGFGVRSRIKPTDFGLNIGEFGWDGAAGSYLLIDPERKLSLTMGMHLLGWPDVFGKTHLKLVETVYRAFEF